MSDTPENASGSEKVAGTNLTTVAEFTTTALALSDLKQRFDKLVVDTTTKKGLDALTKDVAELRTLRTGLEKKRKELKAPLLSDIEKLDGEAKRLNGLIVELEEPLKLQLDEANNRIEQARLAKVEAERQRVEGLKNKILALRDLVGSMVGKPSNIINGALVRLRTTVMLEEEFAEYYDEATDALTAVIARLQIMLNEKVAAEEEAKRTELAMQELETLRREKEEREAADRERAMEEARAREDKERSEHKAAEAHQARIREHFAALVSIADGVDDISFEACERRMAALACVVECTESFDFGEHLVAFKAQVASTRKVIEEARRNAAQREIAAEEEAKQRAAREQELQAQADRQAEVERQQAAERERLAQQQRDADKKAEQERLASLGLREAAEATVAWFVDEGRDDEQVCTDLRFALSNDTAAHIGKPARGKKAVK